MNTRIRVAYVCAALTVACTAVAAQSTQPQPAPADVPIPMTSTEPDDGQGITSEYVSSESGQGCAPTGSGGPGCGHGGGQCGCTVGCATHVGYPRCFNFRSPCVGGGAPCGCCGSIFGELLCDIHDWGVRMRSYRAASCSAPGCSVCGQADCACTQPACLEPSCDGGFEPSCGIGVEKASWFRMPSFGCLTGLFGGSGGCSCACNSCGSTCCGEPGCGFPRDAAQFGNTWYPAHQGPGCQQPMAIPPDGGSVPIQEAPMEPIPAPQGSVSGNFMPQHGRKSIHYYSQNSPGMGRHQYTAGPPAVPAQGNMTQVARAPKYSSSTSMSPSAIPPLPMTSTEPEVRVREEIPTAPNAIRRMSYTEFGAQAKAPATSIPARESTVRFADDE